MSDPMIETCVQTSQNNETSIIGGRMTAPTKKTTAENDAQHFGDPGQVRRIQGHFDHDVHEKSDARHDDGPVDQPLDKHQIAVASERTQHRQNQNPEEEDNRLLFPSDFTKNLTHREFACAGISRNSAKFHEFAFESCE